MKFLFNRSSFLIAALLCLCLASVVSAQESTSVTNVSTLHIRGRSSVPTGCSASTVVIYYDLTTHTLKLCQNGGAFAGFGGAGIAGSGTAGQVSFFSATSTIAGSPFFVWDNTNGFLGVRRATPTAILHADNVKPADVGTTPGTAGTEVFRTSGTNTGGDTTIATTGTGGTGSTITINAGAGGKATLAATSSTGGTGGGISGTAGAGGTASVAGTGTNNGGAGGAFTLTPGAGGAATGNSSGTNTGGTGGAFTVQAGTGGAANTGSGTNNGGTGGAINVTGGTGGAGTTTSGNGGAITISGGAAGASGTPGSGGTITIRGGAAAAAAGSAGGDAALSGRNGSSTGTGGAGGSASVTAGNAQGSGNNAGGNVALTPGTATGSGTPGVINMIGPISLNPVTAPAARADRTLFWSQDTAAGDNNGYAINEAGKSERLTGLAARVSTQFDSTNQTPANITGLTFNLEAGKTYSFETTLFTTSDASGGVQIEISGTATATAIIAEILIRNSGLVTQGRVTALDSSVGVTAVTTAMVEIRGTITVNTAGTLTVQAARNAAAGTTSVLVGSYFRLIPQGN